MPPARLVLVDPQVARELRFDLAQLLDEPHGVLAAGERFSAEWIIGARRGEVDRVQDDRLPPWLEGTSHHRHARRRVRTRYRWHLIGSFPIPPSRSPPTGASGTTPIRDTYVLAAGSGLSHSCANDEGGRIKAPIGGERNDNDARETFARSRQQLARVGRESA